MSDFAIAVGTILETAHSHGLFVDYTGDTVTLKTRHEAVRLVRVQPGIAGLHYWHRRMGTNLSVKRWQNVAGFHLDEGKPNRAASLLLACVAASKVCGHLPRSAGRVLHQLVCAYADTVE